LQNEYERFLEAGLGIVAITYDSPDLQRRFSDRFAIEYPLLSDIDTATFRALAILNPQYSPGDRGYGIPYPGIFVVDSEQRIVAKVFIESYRQRLDNGQLLRLALDALAAHAGAVPHTR